eukprot:TRINITY_DN2912_c0_g1_i1.p4 TRINITY_DN2912_c0_g1~~TRINITY_DN2912_c0_g1_i1.p4  ORF type:complete len:56 (-),score=4.41 TRINITY_DN2912_c0_g1_i1:198-365(-)
MTASNPAHSPRVPGDSPVVNTGLLPNGLKAVPLYRAPQHGAYTIIGIPSMDQVAQ